MEISSLALFRGIPPEECGAMMALGCVRTADFEKRGGALSHRGRDRRVRGAAFG